MAEGLVNYTGDDRADGGSFLNRLQLHDLTPKLTERLSFTTVTLGLVCGKMPWACAVGVKPAVTPITNWQLLTPSGWMYL